MLAAVVLALAFGTVPLVANWCAVMCDAGHARAVPACHHMSSATARIGSKPAPCGHDHRPIVLDAATTTKPVNIVVAVPVPTVDILSSDTGPHSLTAAPGDAVTSSPAFELILSSTLRI